MAKSATMVSVEDEVLDNLRRLPLGRAGSPAGTVADLNLPLEFLRRVADRVIQASYRERHRIVVGGPGVVEHGPPPAPVAAAAPDWVTVLPVRQGRAEHWEECRPGVRGFRAPILNGVPWPIEPPLAGSPLAAASKVVSSRLAVDGLDGTLAKVVDLLRWDRFILLRAGAEERGEKPGTAAHRDLTRRTPTDAEEQLRAIGIPTDLAGFLPLGSANFAASAENVVHPIRAMRVQLTGSGYYAGPGDGGSLDVLRQLLGCCPGAHVFASIEDRFLTDAVSLIATWQRAPGVRLMLIPEALPVSQWAQDNAKAGHFIRPGGGGESKPMLLVPRWAGRGEDGGTFIPGETFLVEGLAAAGLLCSQSPMLFEGGNAMLVQEPGGRRVLLLGEAEVHRNVALGQPRERVLDQFAREFGAQVNVVLPAASFHIDLEVTVRTREQRVVAFVPDSLRAVRIICRLAVERLAARGAMSAADAGACLEAAEKGRLAVLLEKLGGAIGPRAVGPGQFPFEFAMLFKDGQMDSGVGNLQRVLFALDWMTAEVTPPNQFPADRHAAAYLRSLRRVEADRRVVHRQLRGLGWEVVAVPAISSESVSVNAVNGVHDSHRYLMPAYGGFFELLDREAASVFANAMGGSVEVVRVLTGETQRRGGGLHCAVCAMPG